VPADVRRTPGQVADATGRRHDAEYGYDRTSHGRRKSVIALGRPRALLDNRSWKRILDIHAENLTTLGGSYWTVPMSALPLRTWTYCTPADELGAQKIDPDDSLGTAADIFVPCATGSVIDDAVGREIKTRVVAGAANKVLCNESAADRRAGQGVILAPDFVANGGGATHLVGREILGWNAEQVLSKVCDVGTTLAELFALTKAEKVSHERAGRRLAQARLADHRAG
jgi:hypothetical protein